MSRWSPVVPSNEKPSRSRQWPTQDSDHHEPKCLTHRREHTRITHECNQEASEAIRVRANVASNARMLKGMGNAELPSAIKSGLSTEVVATDPKRAAFLYMLAPGFTCAFIGTMGAVCMQRASCSTQAACDKLTPMGHGIVAPASSLKSRFGPQGTNHQCNFNVAACCPPTKP